MHILWYKDIFYESSGVRKVRDIKRPDTKGPTTKHPAYNIIFVQNVSEKRKNFSSETAFLSTS